MRVTQAFLLRLQAGLYGGPSWTDGVRLYQFAELIAEWRGDTIFVYRCSQDLIRSLFDYRLSINEAVKHPLCNRTNFYIYPIFDPVT